MQHITGAREAARDLEVGDRISGTDFGVSFSTILETS